MVEASLELGSYPLIATVGRGIHHSSFRTVWPTGIPEALVKEAASLG